MDKDLPNIDAVLNKIKDTYNKQVSAVDSLIANLDTHLKNYRNASKQDLLSEFLERNGMPRTERVAEAAAMALYEAINELPEFKPIIIEIPEVEEPETEIEIEVKPLEWPLLAKISQEHPIAIYGGYGVDERQKWMEDSGLKIERISNEGGTRSVGIAMRFSARVRNQGYYAVIILNELISHDDSTHILAACKASGTLFAAGKKAGKGRMRNIFNEFERRLGG